MADPEYQQEFNNIIERIEKGLYEDQELNLHDKGLTDEDVLYCYSYSD